MERQNFRLRHVSSSDKIRFNYIMLKIRDNTYKYILALGALFFLLVSSSTQACVLADHDCGKLTQVNAPTQTGVQCHIPVQRQVHASSPINHSLQHSSPNNDEECCQLIPADLGDLAQAQVSNLSAQQFSPDWFHLQLTNVFYSSFSSFDFAQREIISPHSHNSSVVPSSPIFPLNSGRAPPPAVLS